MGNVPATSHSATSAVSGNEHDNGAVMTHEKSSLEALRASIEHATHLLPTQGPITVFVHHNTLHAFEDLPFDKAVIEGMHAFGGQPYFSEDRYRQELASGRIQPSDIAVALIDDLGDSGDELLGFFGTRFHLRMAMLEHAMHLGTDAELDWFMAETKALRRFRSECEPGTRVRMIESIKRIARDHANAERQAPTSPRLLKEFHTVAANHQRGNWSVWDDATWEAVTLEMLWQICKSRVVSSIETRTETDSLPIRHRDYVLAATGQDIDAMVNPLLISFTGAFIDQGLATWALPNRDAGFFQSFVELYSSPSTTVERWRKGLEKVVRQIERDDVCELASIEASLIDLGVSHAERDAYIAETLRPLRGWAGMIWQLETAAEWTVRPAKSGTLIGFLAARLLLERVALKNIVNECLTDRTIHGDQMELRELRPKLRTFIEAHKSMSVQQHVFLVFQLAQVRGWLPENLIGMSRVDWAILLHELNAFSSLNRRRIYHLSYECHYRNQALDALTLHAKAVNQKNAAQSPAVPQTSKFQVVTCIDDREESFRRHLEEVAPECETFGVAGFFGVVMYYRGAAEAHFRPLCPAVVKPSHYVIEDVSYSLESSHRTRAKGRQRLGAASHRFHLGTRSIFGGVVTSLAGSLAAAPMVGRILFPRFTAQLKRLVGSVMQPPASTRLTLERTELDPSPEPNHVGYTVDEMAAIVQRILEEMGAVSRLARLVIFVGHGSSSLNNPHESAYNCGACSGAKGGPNARGFAQMANDYRVRLMLQERGIVIGSETVFVGALHNTCDDDVVYFDLDHLPVSHRADFEHARDAIEEARGRNAMERCRRFESAANVRSIEEALRHVETRSEDLSQARPEYNHATCAIMIVGRRSNTRGLFLDRRAFVVAYDPTTDGPDQPVLARILGAAIFVCAGISLEYYFSCVDPVGYGCGSKLPHNIASLLGVMEGATSDLRTGLSAQMVEIHEPMRILTVIETTEDVMFAIMKGNSTIDRLVRNDWIQLALMHPETKSITLYHRGRFVPHVLGAQSLPVVPTSIDWHRGQPQHLGFAVIDPASADLISQRGKQ